MFSNMMKVYRLKTLSPPPSSTQDLVEDLAIELEQPVHPHHHHSFQLCPPFHSPGKILPQQNPSKIPTTSPRKPTDV